MRIVFTVIPEKGHLNPYIPVAQALAAKGHHVAFHAGADIRDQLNGAGLPHFLGTPARPEPPAASRGRYFADRIADKDWLRQWIKTLLIDTVPDTVEPLRAEIKAFKPDVIVTDPMLYQSIIVAEQEGIPYAAISNSLNPVLNPAISSELLDTVSWLAPARDNLFRQHGITDMAFRGCDSLSRHLTGCFTTEDFTGYAVPGVTLAGPSKAVGKRGDETDFPWHKLDTSKKIVFASFGSQIYYQPGRFNAIIAALKGQPDIQLVLSVSELLDTDELADLPDNAIAVRYAPQIALLEHVDLFITHGGANSVMEAMSAGVALLIAPICNDQFHQSWFIKNAGVGDELALNDPALIRDTVLNALNDNTIATNVARVHESYRADGAAIIADKIAELA
jgi:zeaxanthin glucosyltransferase